MTTAATPVVRSHGNAYEIFILALTLLSLVVMVLLLLPLSEPVHVTLVFYDNLICVVFLIDFAYNLLGSRPRSEYLIKHRGWLDLVGSIPTLGILRFTALFRLARLSRLARIMQAFRGQHQKDLVRDVIRNRGQYALFITLLLVMLVLTSASVLVLMFESNDPDANITTGGDALWWAFVTLTTVGYGDRFPVNMGGRVVAVGVMFAGIGVIGALASILASLLVTSTPVDEPETADDAPETADDAVGAGAADRSGIPAAVLTAAPALADQALTAELGLLRSEVAATRADMDRTRAEIAQLRQALLTATPERDGGP
jgi:voltage-gated potassium channel